MSSNPILVAAAVVAASMWCQAAMAESDLSRPEVKAQTRAAEKAGKLVPAGQGPEFKVSKGSTRTRAQRKADTLAERRAGGFHPAGDADVLVAERRARAQPTTVNRAARKAETRAEEKAGLLIPAGEGPGAPKK